MKPLKRFLKEGSYDLNFRFYKNWPVEYVNSADITKAVANKEDLIYLTGDCEEDMGSYDPTKTYVIGGIVDHNKLKGLTASKAKEMGIKM